jgi:phosphinothricin acetyltransferase
VERVDPLIRDVSVDDAEQVAAIYAHHVIHGTASYDTEPPTAGDTRSKIERVLTAGWPFLVATVGKTIVGYAYATQFRDRAAYRFTCENSIYVHPDWLGRGTGKALLTELCRRSADCGFRHMIAVIGGAEPASIALHSACGFELAGRLHAVGWKHGRWLDNVYMQLKLRRGDI